jgi:hypothetical protein
MNLEVAFLPRRLAEILAGIFCLLRRLTMAEAGRPSNLRVIGNIAFKGSTIRSFVIPQSLTCIGMGIFQKCERLASSE